MNRYLATAFFCTFLGMAGGYAIATGVHREQARKVALDASSAFASEILWNHGDLFTALSEHLHQRGALADDPQSKQLLSLGLQGVINFDEASRDYASKGHTTPRMRPESRTRAEQAIQSIRSYPATETADP